MPYVDSNLISWVDYDPAARSLAVRLRTSPVLYNHLDVPEEVYQAFMAAPSKNSFYQQQIAPVFRLDAAPLGHAGDGALSQTAATAAEP